jgi:predicted ATPase/DNA-binding SARP family transcriptional activator
MSNSPQSHRLEIRTLGGLSILRNGIPLTNLASRKTEALLVYLAYTNKSHNREILADFLWDDRPPDRAAGNLRVVLSSLRKELGNWVIIDRGTAAINNEAEVWVDSKDFSKIIDEHLQPDGSIQFEDSSFIDKAIRLYQGEFLSGFNIREGRGFENWLLLERENLHIHMEKALAAMVEFYLVEGDHQAGIDYARQYTQFDPLSEVAHEQLMRLLYYSGQRHEAIAKFQVLKETLQEELGVEPSPETTKVYDEIRAGTLPPPIDLPRPTHTAPSRHNLPSQTAPFIGREKEISEIIQLLKGSDVRLLTLTGPGGVGKTRLAIQTAQKLVDAYPDGITFIDLAPISDSKLVENRIAQGFGIKEMAGGNLLDEIKAALSQKNALILLDNFEQILEAASVVSELLAASPDLDIMITSREALRIYGEQEFPLQPLTVPDLKNQPAVSILNDYESIALFVQRARALNPGFQLTTENGRDVAEICVRLDGLPLAIELAAARIKMFTPQYLLSLLNNALETLIGGPRDLSSRHQTLKAAIEWSYNLLNEDEKKVFARLAVFVGGRTIGAVEAVCGQDLDSDSFAIIESLYDKSLLYQKTDPLGEPRFFMLETLHQYARERLEMSGEEEIIRRKHALYFLDLVERTVPKLSRGTQLKWATRLHQEYDNLRNALDWSLRGAGENAEIGLRLVSALDDFWYYEWPVSDGKVWMGKAITKLDIAPLSLQAQVLNRAGMMAFATGDYAHGTAWNRAALEIGRQIGDKSITGWALFWLSAHATTDPKEYQNGISLCKEAVRIFLDIDNRNGLAWGYNQLGELTRLVEDFSSAREAYLESLAISRQSGNLRREGISLMNLVYVAQHQGDFAQAEIYALEGLAILRDLKLKYHSAIALSMLAGPLAAQGKAAKAAKVLGASEALFESLAVSLQPADRVEINRYIYMIREQLDAKSYQSLWEEGRRLSYEEALEFALG